MDDFKDFEDDNETMLPQPDKDLAEDKEESFESQEEEIKADAKEDIKEEPVENPQEETGDEGMSLWEERRDDNSVVKKYIFYVAKDFIPYIDSLTTDERSAYINDAIQKKIDAECDKKQKESKKNALIHLALMIIIFVVFTPFALLIAHKAIMLTFENYKYSQDNFEKLYKQRFKKDKAFMRSLEYNKRNKKGDNGK